MSHVSPPKIPRDEIDFARIEAVVRCDPGGRGLASFRGDDGRGLLFGELRRATLSLVDHGSRVAIVTGFAILTDDGPRAETDGPPGAILLAAILRGCGHRVCLATDELAAPLLRAGLHAASIDDVPLLVAPPTANDAAGREQVRAWWHSMTTAHGPWSHLVSIERVGPSHTSASVAAQYDAAERAARALQEFESLVLATERDVCRNMRGLSLDACTAPLHRLFDDVVSSATEPSRERPTTIGIVDGGNEIGCGKIPWQLLHRAVARGNGGTIACRTTTDCTIVAGISNWGAYALAAAVAASSGKIAELRAWDAARLRRLIEAIVHEGGAVDGVTKLREPTVDGVALDEYLAVFEAVRRVVLD